jgi:hypothetical protein
MPPALRVVGIDRATHLLPLVGLADRGQRIVRQRGARGAGLPGMATWPRGLVGIDAAGRILGRGHDGSRGPRGHGWHRHTCNPRCRRPPRPCALPTPARKRCRGPAYGLGPSKMGRNTSATLGTGGAHGPRQRKTGALGRVWQRGARRGPRLSHRLGGAARRGTRPAAASAPGTVQPALCSRPEGGSGRSL